MSSPSPASDAAPLQGVRAAGVAGLFYPDDPDELRALVTGMLRAAGRQQISATPPKAIIAPHAGYVYSGPIAAEAYVRLQAGRDTIRRVVLMGPNHRYGFRGLALASAARFATPLGEVPVDAAACERIRRVPGVRTLDKAYEREHSLEVHLPFLQATLGEFQILPLLVGEARPEDVAEALRVLWGGPETCIVISSDLSHYLTDAEARRRDGETARLIEAGDGEALVNERACGHRPIRALLQQLGPSGLSIAAVDLRNSSQTGGDAGRVVGYGAFITRPKVETPALSTRLPVEEQPARNAAGPADHRPAAAPSQPVQRRDPLLSGYSSGIAAPCQPGWVPMQSWRPASGELSNDDRLLLLNVVGEALAGECSSGQRPTVNVGSFPPPLQRKRATFVTLKQQGLLRGCVGTVQASEPLVLSVVHSAGNAAFRDSRFPPLSSDELADLEIHISILSPLIPCKAESLEELAAGLRSGVDGLTVRSGDSFAVFLPSVWEQIPDQREFVERLLTKAGLTAPTPEAELQFDRFTVDAFSALLTRRSD